VLRGTITAPFLSAPKVAVNKFRDVGSITATFISLAHLIALLTLQQHLLRDLIDRK